MRARLRHGWWFFAFLAIALAGLYPRPDRSALYFLAWVLALAASLGLLWGWARICWPQTFSTESPQAPAPTASIDPLLEAQAADAVVRNLELTQAPPEPIRRAKERAANLHQQAQLSSATDHGGPVPQS